MLLKRFTDHVSKEGLFNPEYRLFIAVSGGIDSVVLTSLCKQAGYRPELLHVNYGLRAEESDRDEEFVRTLAANRGLDLQVRKLDAGAYASEHRCSIQVAARELRYQWFTEEIAAAGGAARARLLTAHHLDDALETSLMNFLKGTGIAGLRGIRPLSGWLARPLLFATRQSIAEYASQEHLTWVHDSSNDSNKYTRNFLRNQVIPLISEVYPMVEDNLLANQERFREADELYQQSIGRYRTQLLLKRGAEFHLPVRSLRQVSPLKTILWELLQPFAFTPEQLPDLLHLLDAANSRFVASPTHRVIRNREWLIVAPVHAPEGARLLIEGPGTWTQPMPIGFEKLDAEQTAAGRPVSSPEAPESPVAGSRPSGQTPARPKKKGERRTLADASSSWPEPIALLDARDLQFPLTLRRWKPGDYFYPLGMPKKKKKLARFLIDQKLSKPEKESIYVLEDAGERIVWVVGHRIDDRFKMRQSTSAAYRLMVG